MSRTYRKNYHHSCALRRPKTTGQRRQIAALVADLKFGEYDGLPITKINRAHRHIVNAYDDLVIAAAMNKYARVTD